MRAIAVAVGSLVVACGDPASGLRFERHVIDTAFRAEGVTVFDVNHDGALDLVTEELWYAGPDFVPHEVRMPRAYNPDTEYAHCFHAFHRDVDTDGFDDLIVVGPPGNDAGWCRNPQGADVHWDCHPIIDNAATMTAGESPAMVDVFATGAPSLVMGLDPERFLALVTPGASPELLWDVEAVSARGFLPAAQHGLGLVDINADGRLDVVTGAGWLEQPAVPAGAWPWHPVEICPNNCAHIAGFDINADGLVDLVGTSPHGYGAWWFEQRIASAGAEPTFTPHLIDDTVSQTHAARLVDLDGDGAPELITGKRWRAHFMGDPGTDDPIVLVVYQYARAEGAVTWTRIDVDADSGIGNQFEVIDVSADGKPDIVVATRKGVFVFTQR